MAKKSLTEMLRGSPDRLRQTNEAVAQAIANNGGEGRIPQSTTFAKQMSDALRDYTEMTADFVESLGEQAVAAAESYLAESKALADNIRKCGDLEAERTESFVTRMRELGTAMATAKKSFESATGIQLGGVITSPAREAKQVADHSRAYSAVQVALDATRPDEESATVGHEPYRPDQRPGTEL